MMTFKCHGNKNQEDEKEIHDVWEGARGDLRRLSDWWTGETVFHGYFREPPGYRIVQGRMTRRQKHSTTFRMARSVDSDV